MLETILIVALILLCYAVFVEPRWFKIKRVQIQSRKKISAAPFGFSFLSYEELKRKEHPLRKERED